VIPNYSILNYSIIRNFFFKDPGYPGDSISSIYSLSLSVFSYFSFLFSSLSPSLYLFLSFSVSIPDSDFTYQALNISNSNFVKNIFFQIEKAVPKLLKLMLDYSKHLLKLNRKGSAKSKRLRNTDLIMV
jgi:hypothetical protein